MKDGRGEGHGGVTARAVVVLRQRQLEAEDAAAVQTLAQESHAEERADVALVREHVDTSRRVAHQVLELCTRGRDNEMVCVCVCVKHQRQELSESAT